MVNRIYYATDDPAKAKSHHKGVDARFGAPPSGDLLIVTGPLALNWRRKRRGIMPALENGEITGRNPATADRIDLWIETNVHIKGWAGWVFVKIHTHGTQEETAAHILGNEGGGLYVAESTSRLLHNTIAHNTGGDGSGIYINRFYQSPVSTVWLTDTILVSHTVGISVTAGNTVTLDATLWGNDADWGGAGTIITGTTNVWGNPAFVDPDAGDYHIGPNSAARDAGINAGVFNDIDGDPRPYGPGYDIGADEVTASLAVVKRAYPNPVPAGSPLTYTLRLTNTGVLDLHATITDVLPAHVMPGQTPSGTLILPGGLITWAGISLAPDEVWTETLVVTVELDYAGPLTNVVRVGTQEGVTGVYTETSLVLLAPPIVPHLLAPPDGTLTTSTVVTLSWQTEVGPPVEGYNLDLDGAVVTTTATTSSTLLSIGVHTWTVRAFNQAGYSDWADPWTFEITQTSQPCTSVTGVDLSLLTPAPIYAGDTVSFSADLSPDDASLPYTYTVSVDGATLVYPQEGSSDPLIFSHTFPVTGVYVVEVAAWNCGMDEAGAVTGTVGVEVIEPGGYTVYLPVVMRGD